MVPVEVSIAILNHIADSRLVLLNGKRTAIAEHARSRFADRGRAVPTALATGHDGFRGEFAEPAGRSNLFDECTP
jgi:hypothetical protein